MSAPPIFRLVDERRVSVVRDAAAVRRVLDGDPVGCCMVAARVAEHGIEPTAIGGELWTRRGAEESLCYAGANLIPLRGTPTDLHAFADKAMSSCASVLLGGRPGRVRAADVAAARTHLGTGPGRARAPAADGDGGTADVCDRRRRAARARRRARAVSGRRDRHVHRRGRYRSPAGRRRARVPPPRGGADRRRPRVGAVRARQGDLQGGGRFAVAGRRSDPGRLGASRMPGAGAGYHGDRGCGRVRSSTAAGWPACT